MGYSSSKTLATVGEGTLHVKDTENSDDMERLNRDTSKVNKDLYSGSVGTSVTATLDHRLLSEDGWKLIAQDFVKTGMLLDTINQVVSNQTVGLSEFGAELRKREITYETVKERIAQDKDLAAMLNSPAYTDEQKKAITNGITQQVMVELGYKPIENVLIATTEPGRDGYQIKGYFSLETGKAYINDFYNNSNADLLKTAGTETQRAIDAQEGSKFDQSKEYRDARSEYSQNFGSNIASYADFALYFTGQGSLSTANNSISTTAQTQNNNAEFAGLDKNKGDNAIYLYKDKITATDRVNDHKVVDLTTVEALLNGFMTTYILSSRYPENSMQIVKPEDLSQYKNVYDLSNPNDFETLRKETDMSYNNINQNTKILFVNGMDNTKEQAEQSQAMIQKDFPHVSVGLANNQTGSFGVVSDVGEWLPNYLTKKDVLNAYQLQQLAPNSLVISHSAGNEDIYKANLVNSLVNARTSYYLLSVASPKSEEALKNSTAKVGAILVNQVNHPNDPVVIVNMGANYDVDFHPIDNIKNKILPIPIAEDLTEHHPFSNYYNNGIKEETGKVIGK